jgi:hypothetical protein
MRYSTRGPIGVVLTLLAVLVGSLVAVSAPPASAADLTFYSAKLRVPASKHGVEWHVVCPKNTEPRSVNPMYDVKTGGIYVFHAFLGDELNREGGKTGRRGIKYVINNPSPKPEVIRLKYVCYGIAGQQPEYMPVDQQFPDLNHDCIHNAADCRVLDPQDPVYSSGPSEVVGSATWNGDGSSSSITGGVLYSCYPDKGTHQVAWAVQELTTYTVSESIAEGINLQLSGTGAPLASLISSSLTLTYQTQRAWTDALTVTRTETKDVAPGHKAYVKFTPSLRETSGKILLKYKDGLQVYRDKPGQNTDRASGEYQFPFTSTAPDLDASGYLIGTSVAQSTRMTALEEEQHCDSPEQTGGITNFAPADGTKFVVNDKTAKNALASVKGASLSPDVSLPSAASWPVVAKEVAGAQSQEWSLHYVGVNPYFYNLPMYQLINETSGKCLAVGATEVSAGKRDLVEQACGTSGVANAPGWERRQWFMFPSTTASWRQLVPFEYPSMMVTAPNSGCGSFGGPYLARQPQFSGLPTECGEWGLRRVDGGKTL